MRPVARRLRAIGLSAALLGAALFPLVPARAQAADDVVRLPGATSAAVRVDMDGDGVLDLARVLEAPGEPSSLEVWVEDGTSGWDRAASVPVPWPTNGDVDASNATVGAGLLVARIGGVSRLVLGTTLVDPGADSGGTCCVTIHVAGMDGGRLELDTHAIAGATAEELLVLDFDGDGTDELVAIATRHPFDPAEPPSSTLRVLGWRGGELMLLAERERAGFPMGSVVGDVDGRPGVELISALESEPRLERLAWDGSELAFTDAGAPAGPQAPGWPAGVLDGHLVYVDEDGVSTLAWPADDDIRRVGRISTPEFPGTHVVGSGDASLLIVEGGQNPFEPRNEITIYDESLERLGAVTVPPATAEARRMLAEMPWGSQAMPYGALWGFSGLLPSSDGEADGWMTAAGIVRPEGTDGWRLEPIAPMLGAPIGRLGHGDAWLAICEACWNTETRTFLWPSSPLDRSAVVLAPLDALPPDDGAPMEARYDGAIVQEVEGSLTSILARPSGAVIEIPLPPSSEVMTSVGGVMTPTGRTGDRFWLNVPGVGESGRRDSWGATVLVIGPDTRFRIHRWEATYAAAGGPAVTALAAPKPLELSATVTGTADPGTRIAVDGVPVALGEGGHFAHAVWATPWPRTIAVSAIDPLGTERTVGIEVVGFVDARGLPWVPMVATVTLLFAALLFLRVPRGERRRSQPDGDGSLEELDGDLA